MAQFKLTKNELRNQQNQLLQLQKYLPTLQLKKAMLQMEINQARMEVALLEAVFHEKQEVLQGYSSLFSEQLSIHPSQAVQVKQIDKRFKNIAGVEIPIFDRLVFEDFLYSLFDTPPWFDQAVVDLKQLVESRVRISIAKEKKQALEEELRVVSIRVNLFEKNLIPRSMTNIKKIKIFLGDQQLAAVSRAKVAKSKIEERKQSFLIRTCFQTEAVQRCN